MPWRFEVLKISQSGVSDASPHDLPERSTVPLRNGCLRGKRENDATYGG